jgi:hypothetical protein
MLAKASFRLALTTIVVFDRSFIVLANGVMIINYDRKSFIVQATGAYPWFIGIGSGHSHKH